MSVLETFFEGFGFRSAHPVFEPGEELSAYVTGFDQEAGTGVIRIGDTVIEVPEASRQDVDRMLQVRVISFDRSEHRGTAELIPEEDRTSDREVR